VITGRLSLCRPYQSVITPYPLRWRGPRTQGRTLIKVQRLSQRHFGFVAMDSEIYISLSPPVVAH
jgi:hypothetical protein